jgi:hypothetical protein
VIEKLSEFFGVSKSELIEENGALVNQNNHNNGKVSGMTLDFTDQEVVALLKNQISDKDELIRMKDQVIKTKDEKIAQLLEKITLLEQKLSL